LHECNQRTVSKRFFRSNLHKGYMEEPGQIGMAEASRDGEPGGHEVIVISTLKLVNEVCSALFVLT